MLDSNGNSALSWQEAQNTILHKKGSYTTFPDFPKDSIDLKHCFDLLDSKKSGILSPASLKPLTRIYTLFVIVKQEIESGALDKMMQDEKNKALGGVKSRVGGVKAGVAAEKEHKMKLSSSGGGGAGVGKKK